MSRPGWRSSSPRETILGRRPTRLLLGGLVVAGVGFLTFVISFAVAFGQWTGGEDPSPVLDFLVRAGLLAIPCGAVLVALALGWWVFRIARWVWRNTPE